MASDRGGADRADLAADMQTLLHAGAVGLVAGTGGRVRYANEAFLRLVGRDRAEVLGGKPWHELTTPATAEAALGLAVRLEEAGEVSLTVEVLRPDGRTVPVLAVVTTTPEFPRRWVAVVVDVSHDDRLRDVADNDVAIVSTLLDDAPVGFALLDTDLRFLRINRELAQMNGFPVEEHIGRHAFELLPHLRPAAEGPLHHVLATGEPMRDVELVGETPAEPGVEHVWLESFFPVRTPTGEILGIAGVARDETPVRRLQQELATTMARQRAALEELQSNLLPALPRLQRVDLAARYVPAGEEIHLGGDWYDAVRMPDGRLFMSVGDVVGHGLAAAGLMARASAAMRAYVSEGHGPAGVLSHLDALLSAPDFPGMATAVAVALDLDTGELEYSVAGHPYPLLRDAAGRTEQLRTAQGPLLGLGRHRGRTSRTATLEPGGALVLYTDGLVERRDQRLEHGIATLVDALSGRDAGATAAEIVQRALGACHRSSDADSDDICLLVARRPAVVPKAPAHLPLP